jgi:2-dehydropantoate 2-reductase
VSKITEPGVIRQTSPKLQDLTFGELDGRVTPRAQRVLATLEEGGFNASLSRDISRDLWTKFLFICALSGVCALTRLPIGVLRENPGTRELIERAMREVETLARARGVDLDHDVTSRQMNRLDDIAPDAKTSMARDLERGQRLEVAALNGAVARLSGHARVASPVNDMIWACLGPYADGAVRSATT